MTHSNDRVPALLRDLARLMRRAEELTKDVEPFNMDDRLPAEITPRCAVFPK